MKLFEIHKWIIRGNMFYFIIVGKRRMLHGWKVKSEIRYTKRTFSL